MSSNVDVDGWRRPWAQHAAALAAFVATAVACGAVMAHAFQSESVGQFFAKVPESMVRGVLADVQRPVQLLAPAVHHDGLKLKAKHAVAHTSAPTHVVTTAVDAPAPQTTPVATHVKASHHTKHVVGGFTHHGHGYGLGHRSGRPGSSQGYGTLGLASIGNALGQLVGGKAAPTSVGNWPSSHSWGSYADASGTSAQDDQQGSGQQGDDQHGRDHQQGDNQHGSKGHGGPANDQAVGNALAPTVATVTGGLAAAGQALQQGLDGALHGDSSSHDDGSTGQSFAWPPSGDHGEGHHFGWFHQGP